MSATTYLAIPILAKSCGSDGNATGTRVFLGVTDCALPVAFANQVRARLGGGTKFVDEDQAADILAGRVDEIADELRTARLDLLISDLEIAKRLSADARKLVASAPADGDLDVLDGYRDRLAGMLEAHQARPVPVKAIKIGNLKHADPNVSPLRAHPAIVDALRRLDVVFDKVDQAEAGLCRAKADVDGAIGKAKRLRSGTIEGLAERVRQAEAVPDHRRELGEIAHALAGLASRLAALVGAEDATAKREAA